MKLRFKRNYPILVLLVLVVTLLSVFLGNERVIAYTLQSEESSQVADDSTEESEVEKINIENSVMLFDDTQVHSIQIIMDGSEYALMQTTYQQTGEKDTFHADIIIDGVRINDIGIRLKGNASLRVALGGGMGGRMRAGDIAEIGERVRPEMGEGFMPPEGVDGLPVRPENADGFMPPSDAEMPNPGFPGAAEEGMLQTGEIKVPYLIRFDKYVSGQTYQGYSEIAIRNYGSSYDEAMLAEPLTNDVFNHVGLPATNTVFAGVALNEEAEKLYVISEIIDETFLEEYFPGVDGILYKAELGSSLSYIGDDPSNYTSSFTQETRVNDADMAPLIEFMRFLTESDDAAFASELAGRLDIDSFAAYLAINNLLVNTDSIAGMNNNYYLYFNEETQQFTVLMWDANESMGGLGRGSESYSYDIYYKSVQGMRTPGGGKNLLVERFMENPEFLAIYEEKVELVYEQAFLSGFITQQAQTYAGLITEVNDERSLVDMDSYSLALDRIISFVEQRQQYLGTTTLLANIQVNAD